MIKYNLIVVGNLKEKFFKDAQEEYLKRLGKFASVKVVELQERNNLQDINTIIKKESEDILTKIDKGYNILLDIGGKNLSSEELSKELEGLEQITNTVNFIIGGSYGVSNEIKGKVDYRLSFSKMTFPHQLARIMLLEQIYRAKTISNNMPYHK